MRECDGVISAPEPFPPGGHRARGREEDRQGRLGENQAHPANPQPPNEARNVRRLSPGGTVIRQGEASSVPTPGKLSHRKPACWAGGRPAEQHEAGERQAKSPARHDRPEQPEEWDGDEGFQVPGECARTNGGKESKTSSTVPARGRTPGSPGEFHASRGLSPDGIEAAASSSARRLDSDENRPPNSGKPKQNQAPAWGTAALMDGGG